MIQRLMYSMLSKLAYSLCLFSVIANAQDIKTSVDSQQSLPLDGFDWSHIKKAWDEDVQFHGFLSQGLFHTSGNNVFGKSKNSVSAGLTEVGLNISYQVFNPLSFAAQGLYRRAGKNTGVRGEVTLDYAFFDYTFLNFDKGRIGIRGGRVKNPWGLYNETRDVAFTHPTISLPRVYFVRSRNLLLSMDGGQFYADYNASIGDFSFKFNYGVANADNRELLLAVTLDPNTSGSLKGEQSLVTQLNYEILGGQYVFAISYAQVNLGYRAGHQRDLYSGMNINIESFIFSTQFNGEKISLVGEYARQWTNINGTLQNGTDGPQVSEYWYLQAGYRFLDNLQATIRYDYWVSDTSDRSGQTFNQQTGLPAHIGFTQDVVVGLRWDISPSWMARAEYSRVHGSGSISQVDNPDLLGRVSNWNIYALQVAFRF